MLEKEFEDLGMKVADTELVDEDEEVYAQYRNSFSIRLHLKDKDIKLKTYLDGFQFIPG